MLEPNVSIIMPIYRPDKKLLQKIVRIVKTQDYSGKVELIQVDGTQGISATYNEAGKKAKYDIIIYLHQDCIPVSKYWLKYLVEPFKNDKVVATVSKTELPKELWNSFDPVSKILSVKEQKISTSSLDEKACAHRRSALEKVGWFDTKHFPITGQDYDMYLKLSLIGKIFYPSALIIHYDRYTWKRRMTKELQYANGFGALFRVHKTKLISWYWGFLKSIPFIGYPLFLANLNFRKLKHLIPLALILYIYINLQYSYGFWKGFLRKKQTI